MALQIQHPGKTKVAEPAERRKTTAALRARLSHAGNYFQRSSINHRPTYKQQDCTGLCEARRVTGGFRDESAPTSWTWSHPAFPMIPHTPHDAQHLQMLPDHADSPG